MTTKTMIATVVSPPSSPAWAIVAAAASVKARFLGLPADNRAPRPSDLPALNRSIIAIHFGTCGSTPGRGRLRHWATAKTKNRTPMMTLTQLTAVDAPESGLSESPATRTTITLTTVRPSTQPTPNAGPLDLAFG